MKNKYENEDNESNFMILVVSIIYILGMIYFIVLFYELIHSIHWDR